MTGHVHVPFALPIHLGDKCSYAVGAGTLSLRLRGSPPGFNVVEWDTREVRVQAMGWTGSHFEAEQTWSLPRRGAEAGEAAAAAKLARGLSCRRQRRSASVASRSGLNSTPGFHEGHARKSATARPTRQAIRASCAVPAKVHFGSNSSQGWW